MCPRWEGSTRRDRLPSNWASELVPFVKKRDKGVCQHERADKPGTICGAKGTDVDHIERGDDHDPKNLQLLCSYHHLQKSGSEGGYANAAKNKAKKPQKRSPGLIYDDEPEPRRFRHVQRKRKPPP